MRITICGLPFDVSFVEEVEMGEPNTIGKIFTDRQLILIKKSLSTEQKAQTILHEVIHGILIGIGLNEFSDNENLVQGLAQALHQILKVDLTSFS